MTIDWNSTRHLFANQLHHATRRQLDDVGVDRHAIARALARGDLVSVTPRVLRLGQAAPVTGERAMAAVLDHGGDSRASHTTAAAWWGLPGYRLTPIHVARSSRSRVSTELATTHQLRALPAGWCTTLRGLPVVRPEVCILQLCGTQPRAKAARALDAAWSLRLLSRRSVIALLAQYGEMGRNGTAVLRDLIDERSDDYVPPASNVESRLLWLLGQHGLNGFRCQVDAGGEHWSGRVDFRHAHLPLVIEVQSQRHHTALTDREHDDRRRAALEADGFVVVEVWDDDLWTSGADVVANIERALALVRRSVG